MSSWWGNKLGAPDRSAPPRPSNYQPPPPSGYQPPAPVGGQQPPGGYYTPPQPQGPPVNENGEVEAGYAMRAWQGTAQAQDGASCPACGSFRYFSRQGPETGKISATGQMVYPSPECFECGYPKQQGTIGVSAASTGAAAPARQDSATAGGSWGTAPS